MNALLDAVATSILAEVTGANAWTFEKKDPMWRNPSAGKVLNIYSGGEQPGTPRWTGGTIAIEDVIVEYAEPAPENARNLTHDVTGEYAANAEAMKIRNWALNHPAGFSPAHKMDVARVEFTPQVDRELFVRYCRVVLRFELVLQFG